VSDGSEGAAPTMAGAKILIVDDDRDTLLGLTLILRKKGGYQVVAASDAVQAMMVAIREKPDLIVLDIGLPGGSGLQVLRNLKSNVAMTCTPVIMLTARDASLEGEALRAGADAFFQKPADPDALLSAVRSALQW
jgi:two-component system OmpR family response regulator